MNKELNKISINPTFGFHASAAIDSSVGSFQTHQTIHKILDVARKTALAALVILGTVTAIGLTSGLGLIVGVSAFVSASAFYYSQEYYNYKHICQTAGIVFRNSEEVKKFEVSGIQGKCAALPTEHSADTEVWRKELIEAAEHHIVISGNYCGGKSFGEFLRLVEKRMQQKPNLKVIILSSPNFIGNDNNQKIEELKKNYPGNFSLVESPDILHVSTGLKKSTNHTKCMVVDYGKYFILGGSGIQDGFVQTGLDHLPREEFLKQINVQLSTTDDPNADNGLIGKFLPRSFRDMDFVFRSSDEKPSGKQVYKQMLLLAYRWEQYNQMLNKETTPVKLNVDQLGVFTNESTPIESQDSVTVQLLKTPIPKWKQIVTRVPKFDQHVTKASDVAFQIFASGPEHNSSILAAKLVEEIKKAKKQIVINHMYFQPTAEVMNALVDAAKRKVKVKIITAGIYKDCPTSHQIFGPRNKYNYAYLVRSLSQEQRKNVEVYEYQQRLTSNHKKLIVIDDLVIAGSSNLGYKSLVTTSDHELNFFARSRKFAKETLKICDIDMRYSERIKDPAALKISDYARAALHRLLAPVIG